MAAAALSVLQEPQFAEVFGAGSRPEVGIAGTAAATVVTLTAVGIGVAIAYESATAPIMTCAYDFGMRETAMTYIAP